ncbi:anion exchange transporter isoform X3 [Hyperolius riggenbachi]|uniref:anion exchange transporter isoform X3 n=1 Tax=Hyperolius riggenbachi TaxID=752182 RepID=UPI0035A2D631
MADSCRKSYLTCSRISSLSFSDVRTWCLRRLPILQWAPRYNLRQDFIPDCVSGMALTVYQVTQGLAFAVMSSVHPVFGLYGSFFPPLIYAIFGMGQHVSTGTFAITSLISAAAVERLVPFNNGNVTNGSLEDPYASPFEMRRIEVAAAVTFLGGVIQMSMSLLQMGCATFLFSEPVVSAMTTGAATHVVTSQVKFLLGVKMPYISGPLGMFYIYIYVFQNLYMIPIAVVLLSLMSLTVLILTKELNEKYRKVIGFVIPIDMALELLAHGLSNVLPSFFFCIPNAGAPARTFLLYSYGAKTQVACLISCLLVLLVIYFVAPLLYWLPMCVLASVIVVGLKGMLIQFRDLKKYWNVDKYDWVIWVCTYIMTICFAANVGLLFGVLFNIAVEVFRITRAKSLHLVHLQEDYNTVNEEDYVGFKIVSVGGPLYFLNAKKFHNDILKMQHRLCTRRESHQHNGNVLLIPLSNAPNGTMPHIEESKMTIILDCEGISFYDFTGVSVLAQTCCDLTSQGTDVIFTGCSEALKKSLQYCGMKELQFFNSVKSALESIKRCRGSDLEEPNSTDA